MPEFNEQDAKNLAEIDRLLHEAYQHYFDGSDGHCKSSEGHISVSFGNYWDRFDKEGDERLTISEVTIYSYVLGPSRSHDFDTTAAALEAVKEWHKEEMATLYCDDCRSVVEAGEECGCEPMTDEEVRAFSAFMKQFEVGLPVDFDEEPNDA